MSRFQYYILFNIAKIDFRNLRGIGISTDWNFTVPEWFKWSFWPRHIFIHINMHIFISPLFWIFTKMFCQEGFCLEKCPCHIMSTLIRSLVLILREIISISTKSIFPLCIFLFSHLNYKSLIKIEKVISIWNSNSLIICPKFGILFCFII